MKCGDGHDYCEQAVWLEHQLLHLWLFAPHHYPGKHSYTWPYMICIVLRRQHFRSSGLNRGESSQYPHTHHLGRRRDFAGVDGGNTCELKLFNKTQNSLLVPAACSINCLMSLYDIESSRFYAKKRTKSSHTNL